MHTTKRRSTKPCSLDSASNPHKTQLSQVLLNLPHDRCLLVLYSSLFVHSTYPKTPPQSSIPQADSLQASAEALQSSLRASYQCWHSRERTETSQPSAIGSRAHSRAASSEWTASPKIGFGRDRDRTWRKSRWESGEDWRTLCLFITRI